MKKKILSYMLAILIFVIIQVVGVGYIISILKFGFEKVLISTIMLIMGVLGIRKLANEIYEKLNKKEI